MDFIFKTTGTCSREIRFSINNNVLSNVVFEGGCHGNLQGIGKLVEGMDVYEVEKRLAGISCGGRPTSCPDQLAKAIRNYLGATI